ncbi:MAG: PEP-CTERM sorting domain-containing protein [Planctomycetota bacterium]
MPSPRTRILLAAALASPIAIGGLAQAQPTGGFIAGLDLATGFTDSTRSVVFFDVDDLSAPLFSVYVGDEDGFEDPTALTVNPNTGLVYVAAYDSGTPGSTRTIASTGDTDTSGDIDLYTIDFTTLYNDWTTNQTGYVQYVPQVTAGPPPFGGDPIFPAVVGGTTQVLLEGSVTKIGEVASSRTVTADFPATAFENTLEFIDEDTLVYLDDDTDQLQAGAEFDNEIRIFKRIDTTPTYNATTNEGGFTNGSENWTSTIVGRVNLDSTPDGSGGFLPAKSSPENFAAYRDPVSGITGVWIQESDGGSDVPGDFGIQGDDISFFEITNEDGTAGNGYRPLQFFGAGTTTPNLTPDDNPVDDAFSNDGAVDRVMIDPTTGNVLFIESDFFDATQGEPGVVTVDIASYDDGNGSIAIAENPWSYDQIDGNQPGDDDTAVVDGRSTVYDFVNNDVYFFDRDNPGEGNGGSFDQDWWKLDLDTGETTLVATDSDNLQNFDQGDYYEFFFLAGVIEGIVGDYDDSGSVEQGDLNLVLNNWGQDAPFEPNGDPFASLAVDQEELNRVLNNWGNTENPPSFEGFTVPEPGALAMLGGLALAGLRRRSA